MAFGNYNNNQNQSSGVKRSWKVGKDLYASNGKVAVGLYESDKGGTYCSFQIIGVIGKDPQTGANVYEQRPPQELPSILFTQEVLEAVIDRLTDKTRPSRDRDFYPNWVSPVDINETINCGHNASFTINGSANEVKIKINSARGEKECILTGIPMSTGANFASWRIMLQKMFFVLTYMQTKGIDPEKFANVMSSTSGGMTLTEEKNEDNLPI